MWGRRPRQPRPGAQARAHERAEISDATVDQKDLAMVSLTRFELRKPSQRRVEFDHFGARPDERRKGPSIESVGSDCIEDDSNGDALPHAIFETRDEPLARFIRRGPPPPSASATCTDTPCGWEGGVGWVVGVGWGVGSSSDQRPLTSPALESNGQAIHR